MSKYKSTKYMLMNGSVSPAAGHEEIRVAIVEGSKLDNIFVGHRGQEQLKGNIYKAIIKRKEPSLEAYFVDYGAEKHGFLPYKEVVNNSLFSDSPDANISAHMGNTDQLSEGQEIMVQIAKDERGTKGAALTAEISLAGIYIVIMPKSPKAGGISRQIEGQNREKIKEILNALPVPKDIGIIIRTAGVDKNLEELKWDLSILLKHWEAIQQAYHEKNEPFLIHQESNIIIRAIRDYMREDIDEIYIDNLSVYETVLAYINQVRPDFIPRIKLYQSHIPLFSRFQIESQIEDVFKHEVRLPSGGAIVINHTEALVSIDVNSARATRGVDIEETALNTNCEAADEIARQLRIRDTGGLIVIDFIDMFSNRHQREVEDRLKRALEFDRARVQIGRISKFGLLEMSRQRLRTSLGEITAVTCPRCSGHGTVRTIPSLTLSILRLIEEESLKESTTEIRAQLPVDVATYLLNEKRDNLLMIEKRHEVKIWIIPNTQLTAPHFKIEGLRGTDQKNLLKSYELPETPPSYASTPQEKKDKRPIQEPAVKSVSIAHPHPSKSHASTPNGLIKKILTWIFGNKFSKEKEISTLSTPSFQRPFASHPQRFQKNNRPQGSFQKNPRPSQSRHQRNKDYNYREKEKDLRNNKDNKDNVEKNLSSQTFSKKTYTETSLSQNSFPSSTPSLSHHTPKTAPFTPPVSNSVLTVSTPLSSSSHPTSTSTNATNSSNSSNSNNSSNSLLEKEKSATEFQAETNSSRKMTETTEIKAKPASTDFSAVIDKKDLAIPHSSSENDISDENAYDQVLKPYNTHKRRGRHLRRGGGSGNYRYKQDKQDLPPDENA